MSSPSALAAVQDAYYARLRGDEQLGGMVTGVFDQVPEGQRYPYIVIGDGTEIPDNAHNRLGRQVTQTLHIWSQYRGYSQAQSILARVVELLDHERLILDGHLHISTRFEFSQTLTDPAPPGDIRHIPVRFRTITAKE